ncbi:hypothetical protein MKEN_00110500 [Mycena kentingensis (nom. inval.)]|nr:hypothetical protein MKEN_00110500 [Mycena kentingensis (nom. inval.)]
MPFFQPTVPPLPDTLSFAGKTVIVTGANTGLGFAAALQFAQRGAANLILAVRNTQSGEAAKSTILADPLVGNAKPTPAIFVEQLDLSLPSSVKSFTERTMMSFSELHVLLLNAGLGTLAWKKTPETGNEQMLQINYLSNVLLATILLPLLRRTAKSTGAPSHVTFVGSRMASQASFNSKPIPDSEPSLFAWLNNRKNNKIMRYGETKLLVAMWVAEAAARVPASEVIIDNVCPGMVATGINDGQILPLRIIIGIVFALRARAPEVGARLVLNAATADEEAHGTLLGDTTVFKISFCETESGKKMQQKLWKETSATVAEFSPGALQEAGLN